MLSPRCWVLVILTGASALTTTGRTETLEEAWALAEANDAALAAARSEAEAARFDVLAARGGRMPVVTASGAFTQLQDAPAFDFSATGLPIRLPELVNNDNYAAASVTVELPLFTGGRLTSLIAAAEAGGVARSAAAAQAAADLRFAVAGSYVEVQRAERALAVARSNVDSLTQYVSDVEAMFNREVVPRNDLLSAQVARANAEQVRLQAANGLELSKAAYNRRIGQPLDRPFALEAITAAVTAGIDTLPLEALEVEALEKRKELLALQARGEAFGHAADAEKSRLLPQVSLTGGYQYLENQALDRDTFATAALGVRWALFDGGQVRNRSASLRRTQRATGEQLADLRTLIALETRQAFFSLQEARARVDVARGAVEQAEENLRIANQQYAAGLVNSTRVLEAETLRVTSLQNRDNAALDAELARLRLARVAGRL